MQLQGVNYKGAFALEAADEDPHRFSKASKLAAYGGFSPIVDSSGDEEENAKRRGGLHKLLDGEGRQDVKFFFTEAGQSVLTSCANSKLGKWGWAMVNRGKPRNKVACAIGRKLITYGWHILRGDPTPNRDSEAFFKRKKRSFHQAIGAKRMHELGYDSLGTVPTRFTTDHAETRFAGHGRQFEKTPFGSVTGNPPAGHGLRVKGRWMCEAKISNRLPRPAEPVSVVRDLRRWVGDLRDGRDMV